MLALSATDAQIEDRLAQRALHACQVLPVLMRRGVPAGARIRVRPINCEVSV